MTDTGSTRATRKAAFAEQQRIRVAERLAKIKKGEHLHVGDVNEKVAIRSTIIFGSMWMFYAFFLYGFIPLIPSLNKYQDKFLYWGSWIQLWALPLLMVGGIVLNRGSERRATEDHEALMGEIAEIKEMHGEILEMLPALRAVHEQVCGSNKTAPVSVSPPANG